MAKLKVSVSSALSTSIMPVLNIVYIMVHRCHNWRSVPCSQHYFHHISPRGAECGGWRQQQQIYNSQLTTTRNKNKYFAAAATPEIEMEAEQELGLELRWLIGKVWKFLNPLVLAYERWPASPRLRPRVLSFELNICEWDLGGDTFCVELSTVNFAKFHCAHP